MSNPITGLVQVTGPHDAGKTSFALSCGYKPSEMFIVDDDVKTKSSLRRYSGGLGAFTMYHDLVGETAKFKELELHAYGLKLIAEIEKLKPPVVIWDTWTRFESTFHPYVVEHPNEFREKWSPMGEIKGAQQWQSAFQYEAQVIDRILAATPLVILVTHLKDQRQGKVKTGKQIPDSKKTLDEKCSLRLWLYPDASSAKPTGLVLKRIEKWVEVKGGGIEPVCVLPRKLRPCTWQHILEYWNSPIGDSQPEPDEIPNAYELSVLDGTLTEDQKKVFEAYLKFGPEEYETIETAPIEAPATILQLFGLLTPEDETFIKQKTTFNLDALQQKDVKALWEAVITNRNRT